MYLTHFINTRYIGVDIMVMRKLPSSSLKSIGHGKDCIIGVHCTH